MSQEEINQFDVDKMKKYLNENLHQLNVDQKKALFKGRLKK